MGGPVEGNWMDSNLTGRATSIHPQPQNITSPLGDGDQYPPRVGYDVTGPWRPKGGPRAQSAEDQSSSLQHASGVDFYRRRSCDWASKMDAMVMKDAVLALKCRSTPCSSFYQITGQGLGSEPEDSTGGSLDTSPWGKRHGLVLT